MSTINEMIFEKHYDGRKMRIPFSDFPRSILSTDLISIEYIDGFYSENESNDSYTKLRIFRKREKTPEEKEESRKMYKQLMAKSKENRRLECLKLKKEFENIPETGEGNYSSDFEYLKNK